MCKEGVQEGAENTALRCSSVEYAGDAGVVTHV